MNQVCRRSKRTHRTNLQVVEVNKEIVEARLPHPASDLSRSIVDLIEVHDRGVVSTALAAGVSPQIVFQVYCREARRRTKAAYEKGFREGRLSPVRPLRSAAYSG